MDNLLEKVKVQVDRGTVNLPEDRKTLQEFGKIWAKVYEALKISPETASKYKNIIKKVANSATTGMIDKLAGRFSFMGKLFDVEVDKSKWSEFAPTPWKIGFVGNIGENIVSESLICELPHGDYHEKGIEGIDFRIEKMSLSQDQKKDLVRNFRNGKGIIGKMPKSQKLMLFTPDGIKVLKGEPTDKSMILPADWSKYAVILKDQLGEIKEVIRKVVREVMLEKLVEGKKEHTYLWVNPKNKKEYDLQRVGSKWEMGIRKVGDLSWSKPVTIKRDTLDQIKDWLEGYKIPTKWIKEGSTGIPKENIKESTKTREDFKTDKEYREYLAKLIKGVIDTQIKQKSLADTVLTKILTRLDVARHIGR